MNSKIQTRIEDLEVNTRARNSLIDAGIETVADLIRKNKDDLKNIDGLGDKSVAEIIIWLKANGLKLTPKPQKKKEDVGLRKLMIETHLKNTEVIDWAKEMRVAAAILKAYPKKEFWETFKLKFKLNSLFFFLTEKGKVFVDNAYYAEKVEIKRERVVLSDEKIGEDIVTHQPKKLKDFLNGK